MMMMTAATTYHPHQSVEKKMNAHALMEENRLVTAETLETTMDFSEGSTFTIMPEKLVMN